MKIEGDEVAAIEIVQYLDELVTTLKMRRTDNFLSFQTAAEKQKLVDEGHSVEDIDSTCHEFFGNLFELNFNVRRFVTISNHLSDDACEYIDLWTGPIMELKIYSWAMLRKLPIWNDVHLVMGKLNDLKLYDANENSTNLHKEFGYVKNYCSDAKIKKWKDENIPISKRWVEIFTHLDTQNCNYEEMAAIVEYILCLPGSTASVERTFASMNKTWTDEKSQLQVETMKAILKTKINLKMTCVEFYH